MAELILKKNADVTFLRKYYKKRGFILRAYKQPDGTFRYTLRKNTYRKEEGGVAR